jgi:5S rRNA maturation endonuclease (ribonuclease M5)
VILLPSVPIDILIDFIKYINSLRESTVIVVEGRNDIDALRVIGIKLSSGKFLAIKGLSRDDVVDRIYQEPNIILLSDFDREGKRIRHKIRQEIQRRRGHGKIDSYPRQLLYKFFRSARINEIEEIKQFQSEIREKLFDLDELK